MSVDGSVPTTLAAIGSPFSVKRTETLRAPSTTWSLVTIVAVGADDEARAGGLALGGAGGDVDDAGGDPLVDRRRRRSAPTADADVDVAVGAAVADDVALPSSRSKVPMATSTPATIATERAPITR